MTKGQQLAAYLLGEADLHSDSEKRALKSPTPTSRRFKQRVPLQRGRDDDTVPYRENTGGEGKTVRLPFYKANIPFKPKGYNFLMTP